MEESPVISRQFRLSDPAEEFIHYSQSEAERFQLEDATFDEALHQQAVELVLRKFKQHRGARHDH